MRVEVNIKFKRREGNEVLVSLFLQNPIEDWIPVRDAVTLISLVSLFLADFFFFSICSLPEKEMKQSTNNPVSHPAWRWFTACFIIILSLQTMKLIIQKEREREKSRRNLIISSTQEGQQQLISFWSWLSLQQTLIERQTNKSVMLTISLDAALESSSRSWHFFFKTCMTNRLTSHAGRELETFLCLISSISFVFVSYPSLWSLKTFLASQEVMCLSSYCLGHSYHVF